MISYVLACSLFKRGSCEESWLQWLTAHAGAQERLGLTSETIESIARNSQGDLRNALHSAQVMGSRMPHLVSRRLPKEKGAVSLKIQSSVSKKAPALLFTNAANDHCDTARDRFPDLFRTVGKILGQPAKSMKFRNLARLSCEQNAQDATLPASKEQWEPQSMNSNVSNANCHLLCESSSSCAPQHDEKFSPEDVIQVGRFPVVD